ncbi:hypothetical protein [Oryzibacter oryziterrae]|uniref:hypothetical protein n=1 Tax=Oryzibacter oryziterrae TaxID=2766474 RepID=UPI001F230FA4|nr:hypothetical protein [Oryzibacter oryziterrae]
MADKDHIAKLIELGDDLASLKHAQEIAAQALKAAGEPPFPKNGCAATLSALLKLAGIDVPMTLGAGKLAHILGGQISSRGWAHIPVGEQQPGDVGVTFDFGGVPGADHVYLVLHTVTTDHMIIADNQAPEPHLRYASGKGGKTPTDYFLRAS